MIEQVTSFRASDRTMHDSACSAWQRELFLWLRANGIENDAIAMAVVRKAVDGRPESLRALRTIAAGLIEAAPRRKAARKPKAAAPQLAAVA